MKKIKLLLAVVLLSFVFAACETEEVTPTNNSGTQTETNDGKWK